MNELHLTNYFPAQTPSVVSLKARFPIRLCAFLCHLHSVCHFVHSYNIHEVADHTAIVIRKLLQGASKLRPSVYPRPPITTYILYLLVRSAPNVKYCYYHSNMLIISTYYCDNNNIIIDVSLRFPCLFARRGNCC